ncbi:MAG: hypothetical protein QOG91_673 [Candidatus Parcubacteria bacterium]|nr:hypothetical protein [Candidatus Parcubacteria bacterium]
MNYELIVNGSPILAGNMIGGIAIVVIVLAIPAIIVYAVWRKLLANENFKYEFITIIAHKFRTPLTTVKWLLEGLLTDEKDAFRRESMAEIGNSNEKLIQLTGTLIELTNVGNEKGAMYHLETAPFCEFVKTIADSHKKYFHEKSQFFSVKCEDPELKVSIDRPRMEFVLQTLFENAFIYTPRGRNIDVTVFKKGRRAVMTVTDHGIGIDSTDLPHIFSKFYRAPNARRVDTEGFGVGLFLAQSIVLRHRGTLAVHSLGLDQGTTFTLSLPAKH